MMSRQQKILVVDDEPINIDVLTGLLKADYRMMVAKNGERALKVARSGHPDLILLDVMMPEMDGYEVCRRLKADPETRDIPVIFITAMGEVEDETRGLEVGAVDYIRKPVSPPILRARVKTQLALVRQREQLRDAATIIEKQRDRMEQELNIGRDIQMSMMPRNFPSDPGSEGFALYARLEAARELGGDFYDFFRLDDGHLCLCIGDVSGKGVPAALFMAVTRTLIRSRAAASRSTAEILSQVNATLSDNNDSCMFVTLFLAICEPGSGELVYTNAGHNPPLLCGAGGLRRLTQRHGPVAGAMPGFAYREDRLRLQAGDTLLLYTDGVSEAMNPAAELFGEERLAGLVEAHCDQGVEALSDGIVEAVHRFEAGAEQADDITVLAFRYRPVTDAGSEAVCLRRRWEGLKSTAELSDWFEDFARSHGLDEGVRRKVLMALDDLVANILSYSHPEGGGCEVELALSLADGRLELRLSDDGIPFDPFAREEADTSASLEERAIGGLGIHLVRRLMDEVSYRREDGRNVVTLSIATGDG